MGIKREVKYALLTYCRQLNIKKKKFKAQVS